MADWPVTMPKPVYDEISIGAPKGAVIRTEMDGGPAKQRKRFTAAPRPVRLAFEPVTSAQLAQFEAFYTTDIAMGSLSFSMEHPITDVARRFRFVSVDEPYSVRPVGKDAYRVETQMELLP